MRMKKKLASVILAMSMAVVGLSGCGASSNGGGSTTGGNSSSTKKTYNIGVCQLVQHPALDAATKGFQAALKDELGDSVKVDVQNASGDSNTCATICNKFVSNKDDLIFANATAALQAAATATTTIPIVGTSITDYGTALNIKDWKGTTGINVTGTSDLAPLDKQADMLVELFPNAKEVGILYCSGEPNSKYQAQVVSEALKKKGLSVNEYTFADSNDVTQVTQSACAKSDVIYVPTDNTAASCTDAINGVALPKKVPIIAGEEGICKGCGVATLSISYYDLGYKAGKQAVKILKDGGDPSKMEIEYAPKVTKEYNATICKKLGIDVPSDYTAIKEGK